MSLLLLPVLLALVPATPTQAGFSSNPDDDRGWVKARVITGGCDAQGNCSSGSRAGPNDLYEYSSDARSYARGSGPAPAHGGHPTVTARQMCQAGGQAIGWSAGTWHHGARWTRDVVGERNVWSGPNAPHWAFAHDDQCRPIPTATPRPTRTPTVGPPPTALPTAAAGQVQIRVGVRLVGTPPTDDDVTASGSGTYPVGAPVSAAVHYPSAWDAADKSLAYRGCDQSGNDWQVTFAAPDTSCTLTFVIQFFDPTAPGTPGPIPTPEPQPCESRTNSRFPLWVPDGTSPTYPGPTRTVSETVLTWSLAPNTNRGHDSGQWDTAQWKLYQDATGTTVGAEVARAWWDAERNLHLRGWRGSTEPTPRGFADRELRAGVRTMIVLDRLEPGTYAIVVRANNSHCEGRSAWSYFQVGAPPPPPSARLIGFGRSPHDADPTFHPTARNADPTRFSWTYGGYLSFYPSARLDPPPGIPGSRLRARITGWHFAGSPPYGTADVDLRPEQPIQVLWSKFPAPDARPQHFPYTIPRVGEPVRIAVSVQYDYTYLDATGQPLGPPVAGTVSGVFTIDLLYPVVGMPPTRTPGGAP